MDLLKGLFNNPTMIRVATDKLRSLFTDDGINTIVLRLNPHNLQPPLPGFDVLMFKKPTMVLDKEKHDELAEVLQKNPYSISELENAQFEALKKMFLEECNLVGESTMTDDLSYQVEEGIISSDEALILSDLIPRKPASNPKLNFTPEKPAADADTNQL